LADSRAICALSRLFFAFVRSSFTASLASDVPKSDGGLGFAFGGGELDNMSELNPVRNKIPLYSLSASSYTSYAAASAAF